MLFADLSSAIRWTTILPDGLLAFAPWHLHIPTAVFSNFPLHWCIFVSIPLLAVAMCKGMGNFF